MGLWRHAIRGIRSLLNAKGADQVVADGLSPEAARLAVRRQFGSPRAMHERVRDYGWENIAGALVADVRFAARMLRKSPVFALVVVLVVSIGSGAVTTI